MLSIYGWDCIQNTIFGLNCKFSLYIICCFYEKNDNSLYSEMNDNVYSIYCGWAWLDFLKQTMSQTI